MGNKDSKSAKFTGLKSVMCVDRTDQVFKEEKRRESLYSDSAGLLYGPWTIHQAFGVEVIMPLCTTCAVYIERGDKHLCAHTLFGHGTIVALAKS